jgi:hypothetical protein
VALSAEASYQLVTNPAPQEWSYGITASTKLWKFAATSNTGAAGTAGNLVATENFMGFASQTVDNSSGAASALSISLLVSGYIRLPITGVTGIGNFGASVYASDNGTFTLTASGNCLIGKIVQWVSGTLAWVKFNAEQERAPST